MSLSMSFSLFSKSTKSNEIDIIYRQLKYLIKHKHIEVDFEQWHLMFKKLLAAEQPMKDLLNLHKEAAKRIDYEILKQLPCKNAEKMPFDTIYKLVQNYLFHRICIEKETEHHSIERIDELIQDITKKETKHGLIIANILLENNNPKEDQEPPEIKLSEEQYQYLQNWNEFLWKDDFGCLATCCM
jgi:hypothetical protein